MCDSFVALSSVTDNKSVFLAKSADCEINEAHQLLNIPHQKHNPGKALRATHIVIPQVEETYEVLLSKSFWTWGCEIGMNQYGLAMGNEAVFTQNQNKERKDGLIGMDLMRLGLERARSCREAIQVMSGLLEEFGQGGNCELRGNAHFDCSYLMADAEEAWILESAGREWCARQVQNSGSISNFLSIKKDWDMCSVQGEEKFNWAGSLGDPIKDRESKSYERQEITCSGLQALSGGISLRDMFNLLRRHTAGYNPADKERTPNICMHAGPTEERFWHANGAMVAEISPKGPMAWVTGTGGTCISIFKPVFMHTSLPDMGPAPSELYDPQSLWWKHETLHRLVMKDFNKIMPEIRAEFDQLEDEFMQDACGLLPYTTYQRKDFMDFCFKKAEEATEKWIKELSSRQLSFADADMAAAWSKFNRQAGIMDF